MAAAKNAPVLKLAGEITGPWQVRFDPKWGGPKAPVTFDTLKDWTKSSEPSIKYFSGTAIYSKTFDVPDLKLKNKNSKLFLDLGTVHALCEVWLNGKNLGVVWTAPWRVDISSAVKTKRNQLEIKVTNVWANRMIGDEQQPADCEYGQGDFGNGGPLKSFPDWFVKSQPRPSQERFTFTSWNYFNKNSSLISSGLLGPLTICTQ
jgi:hypothetical protein